MLRIFHSLKLVLFLITFTYLQLSTSKVIPETKVVESYNDDSTDAGLYNDFKKMTVLNSTNFRRKLFIEEKQKLWLVEFYNHWCGYCIRFSPVMKAFASDVYEWRDTVGIGTVDCANTINNKICRNHEIKTVPSMKIFPVNSDEDFVGVDFGHGSETKEFEIREKLAQILKSYHNSQEKINGSVNLKLMRHSDLEKLWEEFPPTVVYLMLVFEPRDSLVGSQVALDIERTPEIRIRLVDPENKNLTQLVNMEEGKSGAVVLGRFLNPSFFSQATSSDTLTDINDLTKVKLNNSVVLAHEFQEPLQDYLNRTSQSAHVNLYHLKIENFTREGLNKAIRSYLINQGVSIAPQLPEIPVIHTNVSVDEIKDAIRREEKLKKALHVKDLSSVIFQMDLETAVSYAIKNEVSLKKNITGEQLDALKNFITIIVKYFPTKANGKSFFAELKEREVDNKDSVCGDDLRKTFLELDQKYKPFMQNLDWVGCHGTIPILRGYPCGLWTLFHTLVVQEEFHDRSVPDEKPEVLYAMAGYIKNFFSCSQCAQNFGKMAVTIAGNVTTQRDEVMWLWKAHNNVNRRLAGDETEDPRHHKVQFPKKDTCPSCYTNDDFWNEFEVFNFLSGIFTNISHLNPDDL